MNSSDLYARTTRSAMVSELVRGLHIRYHGLDEAQNFNKQHTVSFAKSASNFEILCSITKIHIEWQDAILLNCPA